MPVRAPLLKAVGRAASRQGIERKRRPGTTRAAFLTLIVGRSANGPLSVSSEPPQGFEPWTPALRIRGYSRPDHDYIVNALNHSVFSIPGFGFRRPIHPESSPLLVNSW